MESFETSCYLLFETQIITINIVIIVITIIFRKIKYYLKLYVNHLFLFLTINKVTVLANNDLI
jgi:hypothetical protein